MPAVGSATASLARKHGKSRLRLALTLALVGATLAAASGYYVLRTAMAPAWIRANVIPVLEARYGRRVLFEDFRLSPRGLILGGVRVLEHPSFDLDGAPFLLVDQVVVRFDLLGLLRRTLLIDFVRFVRPEIRLYEDERGRWNAGSLFAPRPVPHGTAASTHHASAPLFRLVITRVELRDATIEVRRAPLPGAESLRHAVADGLTATVMFHPVSGFLDYQGRAELNLADHPAASLTLLGTLDLGIPKVRLDIVSDGLDADALRDFAMPRPAAQSTVRFEELIQADVHHELSLTARNLRMLGTEFAQMQVEIEASTSGGDLRRFDAAVFGGRVHATGGVDLTSHLRPFTLDTTFHDIDVGAMAAAHGRSDIADIVDGKASGEIELAGPWATPAAVSPVASIDLALDDLDAGALAHMLWPRPDAGTAEPIRIDTGSLQAELRARVGTARFGSTLFTDAVLSIGLRDGQLDVSQLRTKVFGGTMTASAQARLATAGLPWKSQVSLMGARYERFVPESERWAWANTQGTVDLVLELAGRGLSLESFRDALTGRDVDASPAFMRGSVDISVKALNLDLLGKPPRERDEYGPLDLGNVTLDLGVSAESVRLWGLDYADVRAKGQARRHTIEVERIAGAIAGGTLELSGQVDLASKGFGYSGQGAYDQVETSIFVDAYLPGDIGKMSGNGSAAFEFSLAGTKKTSALETLVVAGYAALHGGQFTESRMFKRIATVTGVEEFENLVFTRCGGDIHIGQGRVTTHRLVLGGSDARVLVIGGIGFDTSLDAEVWLGFSSETRRSLFSRGILLPYVTDGKDWTYVPFVTRGTLKEPDIAIADEAIRSTALRAIPDATERIVRESSKLVPGGEAIVGGGIDAVKGLLGGLGRILQLNSARAKGEIPLDDGESAPKATRESAPVGRPRAVRPSHGNTVR